MSTIHRKQGNINSMLNFDPNHFVEMDRKVCGISIEMLMKANSTHGWRQWHCDTQLTVICSWWVQDHSGIYLCRTRRCFSVSGAFKPWAFSTALPNLL